MAAAAKSQRQVASTSEQKLDDTRNDSASLDASTFSLPSRKSYFLTVSSIAFAAGLGFGIVFAVRQSRRIRLEDVRAAQEAVATGGEGLSRQSPTALQQRAAPNSMKQNEKTAKDNAIPAFGSALSKGPFALFREMNRAAISQIGGRLSSSETFAATADQRQVDAPATLRKQARSSDVKSSVFDASSSAPPPSVLMRAPPKKSSASSDVAQRQPPQPEQKDDFEEIPLGQQPAIMGVKALGIATVIVGIFAWVGVEVTYRVLRVKNLDELIDRLGNIIPASERTSTAFEPFGRAARKALSGTFDNGNKTANNEDYDVVELKSVTDNHSTIATVNVNDEEEFSHTLDQLDQAVERGDATGWLDIMSRRLNAERTHDIRERQRRIAAASEAAARESV